MSWLPVRRPATVAGPPRTCPASLRAAPVFLDSRSSLMLSQPCCTLVAVSESAEPPIRVVGIGADGWSGLGPGSRDALSDAEVIIGGRRQLALLPEGLAGRLLSLPSPLRPGLETMLADHAGRRTVVLASGDPMHYGIGATLVRLLGAERVVVLPHPSSVSLAAARLGWAVDDVEVVSTVGRPIELLHPALQPGRRLLVLVAGERAAIELRHLLRSRGYGRSRITLLADLGGPDETVRPADDEPHSTLAVIAIECVADDAAVPLPRTPGLPDDAYDQDGQITKWEIRAIALAALAPLPGQLLWDVGAASGSIGIEWMRVHPASRTIAIEPRAERRDRIARNAATLGVPGLHVVAGSAPAALADLPTPDAIFIGGGVTVAGVVEACWDALGCGGRLVANAVTIESERALVDWQHRLGGTLTRIAVERAGPLGSFTTWRPALPVVQWSVRKAADEVNPKEHT
jgi:precorrin-6B C5,15-methyltransferase / cobalt-precorrin-6B C5,C15-methyltransferase